MSSKRVRELLKLRRMEHDRKVAEARIPVINEDQLVEEKEEPAEEVKEEPKEEPKAEKKPTKKRGRPNKKKESE